MVVPPPLLLALELEPPPPTPRVTVSLDWDRERGVAVNAMVVIGEEDFECEEEEVEELRERSEEEEDELETELCGSSAGGAATATLTSASKAEVELVAVVEVVGELLELGCRAIMDFKEGLLLPPPPLPLKLLPLCLEYEDGVPPSPVAAVARLMERPLELIDILASVEPARGMWRVDILGRSEVVDLARPLKGAAFISAKRTLGLVPAGLRRVGESLLVVLLMPFLWLFGGLPLGALTGESEGTLPEPLALRERVGETTAAAAAIKERPEVPSSMLLTSEEGGRE